MKSKSLSIAAKSVRAWPLCDQSRPSGEAWSARRKVSEGAEKDRASEPQTPIDRFRSLTRHLLSDTNSRDDTSRGATTRDDNIDNDYSHSTSSEPPPDVKRARQRARTLRECQ
jgi:hypothetical protein